MLPSPIAAGRRHCAGLLRLHSAAGPRAALGAPRISLGRCDGRGRLGFLTASIPARKDGASSAPSPSLSQSPSVSERIASRQASYAEALAKAKAYMIEKGFDEESLVEQMIVWGHHDQFQHVNNTHYIRFFETGRMKWAEALSADLSEEVAMNMLRGKGVSFILGKINVTFIRPCTYPDTLLVGHRPHSLSEDRFWLTAIAYSLKQQAVVCASEALCVTYDYDRLCKAPVPDGLRRALERREGKAAR